MKRSSLSVAIALCLIAAGLAPRPAQGAAQQKKTIDDLIKDLDSSKREVRVQAVEELAALGPAAAPAVGALLDALLFPDEEVRLQAALALTAVGKAALPALIKGVGSKENEARAYAAWALGRMGADARGAVPVLLRALADPDEEVRRKAAGALGGLAADPEKAVPALVKLFADPDADVREAAAEAAAKFGKAALPAVEKALDQAKTALPALRCLAHLGPEARPTLPALGLAWAAGRLDRRQREQLSAALLAIARFDPDALAECFKQPDPEYRNAAVDALKQLGLGGAPLLLRATRDAAPVVRGSAILALAALRLDRDDAREAVTAGLRDDAATVREFAYTALYGERGPDGRAALRDALKAARGRERINLAGALLQLHADAAARELLVGELKNANPALRRRAAVVLAQCVSDTGKAIPVLVEALGDKAPAVRIEAAAALEPLQGLPRSAVAALAEALGDPVPAVREAVVGALARVGRDLVRHGVLPAVARATKDPDAAVRGLAIHALFCAGPEGAAPLVEVVKGGRREDRRHAVGALMYLGPPAAKQALPALLELGKGTDFWPAVREAVQKIDEGNSFALLLDVLKGHDAALRQALADAGKVGDKPAEVTAALLSQLQGADGERRGRAALALHALLPLMSPREEMPGAKERWDAALRKALAAESEPLRHADAEVRRSAAARVERLGRLVVAVRDYLPQLGLASPRELGTAVAAAFHSRDAEVRYHARRLLRGPLATDQTVLNVVFPERAALP